MGARSRNIQRWVLGNQAGSDKNPFSCDPVSLDYFALWRVYSPTGQWNKVPATARLEHFWGEGVVTGVALQPSTVYRERCTVDLSTVAAPCCCFWWYFRHDHPRERWYHWSPQPGKREKFQSREGPGREIRGCVQDMHLHSIQHGWLEPLALLPPKRKPLTSFYG